MSKHTPGPWQVVTELNCYGSGLREEVFAVYDDKGETHICDTGKSSNDFAKADAALIAAAPEMLEALGAALDILEDTKFCKIAFDDDLTWQKVKSIQKVLAKARGEL